ncbi:unnamed protein product [Gemmata massiliana]|uniref:Uncharacterized protein n=1 Tax=Gemmata massiliana TaxID=1210884 RepID=A0A6P2CZ83_9BACT|nr:hypothetical protein [Gemmata massiliana]VTR92520.1 unnamed protein product [Gemmata massiliana]
MADTRKKANSVRQQVEQLVEQGAAKVRLRDGFQEWLLDRISELDAVLHALEPNDSPLSKAVGSSHVQIYKDLDSARDLLKEAFENTRPRLQPYFLLLEADPELRARVTAASQS